MRATYIQIILIVAVLLSALALVNVRYQSRRLFVELEFELTKARQLEVEWSQLQLDQSNLGKHSRIEASAKQELNMVHVTAANTQFMTVNKK